MLPGPGACDGISIASVSGFGRRFSSPIEKNNAVLSALELLFVA